MTCNNLKNKLAKALVCPVGYLAFKRKKEPPYILIAINESEDFYADDEPYFRKSSGWLEYYSVEIDKKVQRKIEKFFINNKIPYSKVGEAYIKDQELFMTTYNFNFVEDESEDENEH